MDRAVALAAEGLNRACVTRESQPGQLWKAAEWAAEECSEAERTRRRDGGRAQHACRELVLEVPLQLAQIPLAAQWGAACWKVVAGPVGTRPAHLGRATDEYGFICVDRRSRMI